MRKVWPMVILLFLFAISSHAQVNTGGGTSGSSASLAPNTGVFTISNNCSGQSSCLQWVDDDATDNCGAATTTFMAAINAYAGPGEPQVKIGGSGVGKAYLLQTCHLAFLIPTSIHGWATLDAGTNSGTNLIQLGPTGLVALSAAQSPKYQIDGALTFVGGASLTVAGIECEPFISNCVVLGTNFTNFGAGNATAGLCTNYAIQIDTNVAEATIENNEWVATDATAGRCAFGNPGGASVGQNTVYFVNNVIGAATAHCGSTAIQEGGSYGNVHGNNIFAFAVPIGLIGIGTRADDNQIDTSGCIVTTGNPTAIQWGANGSAAAVGSFSITNNSVQFGAGHTTYLFGERVGSTATVHDVAAVGNVSSIPAGTAGTFGPAQSCTPNTTSGTVCYEYGNVGITAIVACGATNPGWQAGSILASCVNSAQVANLGSTTLFTPGVTEGVFYGCQIMLTTAATTSSTLPTCNITYTDTFSNTSQTIQVTPTWASGTIGCSGTVTNTVGNSCQGTVGPLAPKTGTAVTYTTSNYASTGATAMQYQAFVRAITQ